MCFKWPRNHWYQRELSDAGKKFLRDAVYGLANWQCKHIKHKSASTNLPTTVYVSTAHDLLDRAAAGESDRGCKTKKKGRLGGGVKIVTAGESLS
jgi:hypothetical protein